jgi:hypothetical protein
MRDLWKEYGEIYLYALCNVCMSKLFLGAGETVQEMHEEEKIMILHDHIPDFFFTTHPYSFITLTISSHIGSIADFMMSVSPGPTSAGMCLT